MGATLDFGHFSIDTDAFALRVNGAPVAVEPLVLDLIIELTRQPGTLRTRDDLIETVWKGRIVSDTTISTAIKSARKALGDTDTDKRIIRTVRGRGFQFVGDATGGQGNTETPMATNPELPILRIDVATLDDSVSPALSQALTARLRAVFNRIPFLNIVAPISNGGGSSAPASTHLIEIALSSIDEVIYADVSLSDTKSGLQKWARHFSVPSQDVIGNLLAEIGSKAEPQILMEVSAYLAARDNDEPRALILKAMQVIAGRGWNPKTITVASDLLERSIAKDNTIPIAHAILSLLNAIGYRVGMLRHDDSAVKRAIESAEIALSLESQSSAVLGLAGCALCDVGQLARGEPIINRALDLDPMNGHAHAAKGAALMMKGDFAGAVLPLRKGIEISPADSRLAVWGAVLAAAELRIGQIEDARRSAEQAMSRDDVNYLPRLAAVAVHLVADDKRAFKAALKELLRVHPDITSNEVLFFVGQDAKDAIWPIIEAKRE
ncbi:winged helix-turn-helix domain-containing protein [Aliiroseovarius sp. YM-037]|uniref:winged helix-turn-helix domain-containing protein n=1 Tax=Aliiroseovarius sp. YM-037 TaxID=3341728 RepID=UPI003A7FDA38